MFFGRTGPQKSSDTKEAMFTTSKKRRQLAVVSLAVAMSAPVGLVEVSRLYAQETAAAAPAVEAELPLMVQDQGATSSVELLKQAIEQYKAGQYEEAQATIGQIKTDDLSDKNKLTLTDLTGRVNNAADQRKAARSEFEAGQQAMDNKMSADALAHFKNAASNKYVDQGTRQKSLEQIALAESAEKMASEQRKADYAQAVSDYKAGNYDAAKAKFQELADSGYKAGLFQKSPQGYLSEIASKTGQPAEAPKAEAAAAAEAPKTDATASAADEAKANADRQDAAAQAKADADKSAEMDKEKAAEAEAKQAAQAEKDSASARKAESKRLYQLGKEQYKKGDWIAARANLVAAQDMGYKAGLFEDSPATLLARMDKKEQADAAKAAKEAEAKANQEAEMKAEAEAEANAKKMAAEAPKPAAPAAPAEAPKADAVATQAASATPTAPAAMEKPATPAATENVTASDKARQDLEATAQLEKIKQQEQVFQATQLVEQAKAAQQESRYADALSFYTQAAKLDPNNQQAVQGQTEMQQLAGRAPQPSGLLGTVAKENETRRQAISYSFKTALDSANAAIDSGDFRTAQTQLTSARVAAETDPTIFSPEEVRAFNAQAAATAGRLDAAQARAATTEDQRKQQQALNAQRTREAQEAKLRETTVANLIKAARRMIEENKYREAVGVLDQILVIDPNNEYASGVKPLVEDKATLIEQRTYREDFTRQLTKQFNAAEEKMVPYDDVFRYPTNWPDISATRDASVEKERGGSAEDAAVQAQLEHHIPELRFDAIPFTDVVDFLRDITGANIFVNWRALEAAGIDRNTPVTTRLRDIRFSKALDTILRDVGGGTVALSYTVDDGVITISTSDDLSKNTVTRVYDIRDLIVEVPDFPGPMFSLQNASQNGTSGTGGGGQSPFQDNQQQQQQQQPPKTRDERVAEITSLMEETVAPDSWRDAGGTVGSLRELSGQLIVNQTPENQRQLQGLLEQLRETRAIQVTVETRFLTVQRNFLEDIGFDVDFIFNGNNPLQTYNPTGGADPNAVAKVPGTGSFSAIPVINNSSQFTGPSTVATGVPGTLGGNSSTLSGLTTTGTFLDDFQVSFLIRATQATQMSTLLTAPRLTLFNGQTAYVLVSVSQPFVSNLQPVVGTQAVAFQPTIGTVNSGVMLQVQATVSADRKYVTMTLEPTLQTLISLLNFSFQQSSGSTGITSGGQLINTSAGTGIIQEPVTQITQVATTVSVPDGGTLMLGGQTIAGEAELEAGVPILSKIPFLKRLFTNRSTAKDEQVLLILVKPTIIIQKELEEKQFPLLSQKVGQ